MDKITVKSQVQNFKSRFESEFGHFMKEEEYISLFNRWLGIINKEYSNDAQSFIKLILCEKIVSKQLYSKYNVIGKTIKVAMDNADYVIKNDYDPKEDYTRIFSIRKREEVFAYALAFELSNSEVDRYIKYMLHYNSQGTRFAYSMKMLSEIVKGYLHKGDFKRTKALCEWVLDMYGKRIRKDKSLKWDSDQYKEEIEISYYDALKSLGLTTAAQNKKAGKRKIEKANKEQEMRNKVGQERQDMMDQWAEYNKQFK